MKKLLLPFAMFLVATLFYLYEFVLRVAPSSMFSYLMTDFHIQATELGLLTSVYFISYSLLQVPIGALTDRFGPRRLLTFAILLCAFSTLLFAKTTDYFWVCVARFFIGAGSAFAFISCMKIITIWFGARWFPLLTGITLTIGTLGAVAGEIPISFALGISSITWRGLMEFLGYVGLGIAVLAWLLIKDRNAHNPHPSYDNVRFWASLRGVAKSKQNWIIALYGFMVTAPTDAFGGLWGVPFLVQAHGFSREAAATACAMTFVGIATGSPILGWLSTYWENRRRVMWVGSLGSLIAISTLIYSPVLSFGMASALFFAFGFLSSYVLAFVVIRDIMPAQLVGTAVGFVNMGSMIGSSVLIYLMGWVLDFVWDGQMLDGNRFYDLTAYQYSLLVMPVCYILSTFVLIPLTKESYPKHVSQ
jgi:sugar phosphate permease